MPTIDFEISTRIRSGDSQWLFLLPVNDQLHDGKRTRLITQAFCQRVLDQTLAMYAEFRELAKPDKTPFSLPLLQDHNAEGDSFGELLDFKLASKGSRNGIWARVDYTPTGRRLVVSRKKRFVSVRIVDHYMTQRGKSFGPVIAEVSLTNYPRVQSAGEILDTAGMALSMTPGVNMEKLLALFAMLQDPEVQEAIATAQESLSNEAPESDETPPEDAPDESAALAASVAALVSKVDTMAGQLEKVTQLNLARKSSAGGKAPKAQSADITTTQAYNDAIAAGKKPAAARLIASFSTEA